MIIKFSKRIPATLRRFALACMIGGTLLIPSNASCFESELDSTLSANVSQQADATLIPEFIEPDTCSYDQSLQTESYHFGGTHDSVALSQVRELPKDVSILEEQTASDSLAEFATDSIVPIVDFDSEIDKSIENMPSVLAKSIQGEVEEQTDEATRDLTDELLESLGSDLAKDLQSDSTNDVPFLSPLQPRPDLPTIVRFDIDQILKESPKQNSVDKVSIVIQGNEERLVESQPRRIGSAPIIATMKEFHLPFDFSVRDLRLGKTFHRNSPYQIRCVRVVDELALVELDNVLASEDQFANQILENDTNDTEIANHENSLNEFIAKVDEWAGNTRLLENRLRPQQLGKSFADFVVTREGVADQLVAHLESVWRDTPPQPPSPAGAQLLARANAKTDDATAESTMTRQEMNQILETWIQVAGKQVQYAKSAWQILMPTQPEVAASRPVGAKIVR